MRGNPADGIFAQGQNLLFAPVSYLSKMDRLALIYMILDKSRENR